MALLLLQSLPTCEGVREAEIGTVLDLLTRTDGCSVLTAGINGTAGWVGNRFEVPAIHFQSQIQP